MEKPPVFTLPAAIYGNDYVGMLRSHYDELRGENERQRNEIKSLTERDTRLVKARDDARDEVDALKSWRESVVAGSLFTLKA